MSDVKALGPGEGSSIWRRMRARIPGGAPQPLLACWAVFSASVSMFVLHALVGAYSPLVSALLATGSSVSCGLAWLLARALFRPNPMKESWPVAMVAILFCLMVLIDIMRVTGVGGVNAEKFVFSLIGLLGSSVLLLTLLEAIDGLKTAQTRAERRFRMMFLSAYGLLLFFGVILFQSGLSFISEEAERPVQTVLALLALAGGGAATWYRLQHPLPPEAIGKKQRKRASIPACPKLTAQIRKMFEEDHVYRDPQLRITHLANKLGVPEYKVSQCVTSGLGYANFNQLLNKYRIADATRRFKNSNPRETSILEIAFDSGFASIGPFNRAFKSQHGLTPGAFRRQVNG